MNIQRYMEEPLTGSFIITVMLLISVVVIGFVADKITRIFMRLISAFLGQAAAYVIINYLTFPGTIIHELSHALFALLTVAKVTEVKVFERPSSGRLGHVNFTTRGGPISKSLQLSLISCAPVLIGILSSFIFVLINDAGILKETWMKAVSIYLMTSIVIHSSMSTQDIKNYVRGLILIFPLTWLTTFIFLIY